MTDLIVKHEYQGFTISQQKDNGYVNLNQMADANGKRIDHWLNNKSTKELIAEFENQYSDTRNSGYRPNEPIETERGGSGGGGGTWAHPLIAIQFAQWCSPKFSLQVSCWVYDWMTIGSQPSIETGLTEDMIFEVAHLIADLPKDNLARSIAIENIKLLYPQMVFPESISANGKINLYGSPKSKFSPREQYILNRVKKDGDKGVSLTQLYMGFRNSNKLRNLSTRQMRALLTDLSDKKLIDYDQKAEKAYKL